MGEIVGERAAEENPVAADVITESAPESKIVGEKAAEENPVVADVITEPAPESKIVGEEAAEENPAVADVITEPAPEPVAARLSETSECQIVERETEEAENPKTCTCW